MAHSYSYDRAERLAAKGEPTRLDPKSMKPLEKLGDECKQMRKNLQKQIATAKKLQAKFLEGSTRFPPNPKERYTLWFEQSIAALELAENQLMLGDHLGNLPNNLEYDMSRMIG